MSENTKTNGNEKGRYLQDETFSDKITEPPHMKEEIEVMNKTPDDNEEIIDLTEELEDVESYYFQKGEKDIAELKEKSLNPEGKADLMDDNEEVIDLTEVVSGFSNEEAEVIELTDEITESALPVAEIVELTEKAPEDNPEEQEIIELIDEVPESGVNEQKINGAGAESEAPPVEEGVSMETSGLEGLQEFKGGDFDISEPGEEGENSSIGSGLKKTFEFEEALLREDREINEDDPASWLGIEFEEDALEDRNEKNKFLRTYIPKRISADTKPAEGSGELRSEENYDKEEDKKYVTLSFHNTEPVHLDSDAEKSLRTMESVKIPEDVIDAALERMIRKMFSEKIDHILKEAIGKSISEEIREIRKLLLENENK